MDVLRPIAMTLFSYQTRNGVPPGSTSPVKTVGPHTLSGHEVGKAITVAIGHLERVRLREARNRLMAGRTRGQALPRTTRYRRCAAELAKTSGRPSHYVENVHLAASGRDSNDVNGHGNDRGSAGALQYRCA